MRLKATSIPKTVVVALLLPSLNRAFQLPSSPITPSSPSSLSGLHHVLVPQTRPFGIAESRRSLSSSPNQQEASSDAASSSSSSSPGVGAGINGAVDGVTGGSMMLSDDAKSQLFSAFTALELTDQYDAVLTGLCAKILDDASLPEQECLAALQDPIQLVQEMNAKRIAASPRSLMALLDAVVRTQDCAAVATILQLAAINNQATAGKSGSTSLGIQQYGAQQSEILLLPPQPTSRVRCPDGSFKTRTERLESVTDVPADEREKESLYALAFGGLVAVCAISNLLGMDDLSLFGNLILTAVVTVGVLDNFYDVVKSSTEFIGGQMERMSKENEEKNKKDDKKKFEFPKVDLPKVELPSKDSLPLGLGTGQLSGSTVRGLTRLLTVDAEREAQCEAAAFYAAYVLGLPSFAFRPNALEGSVLVLESAQQQPDTPLPPLLTGSGIMRMLIWLMAPVAMENSLYPQLIMSDPREAGGFLQRLEEYSETNPSSQVAQELWWRNDEQEEQDLLKWAYTEADVLLRENRGVVREISNRLTGGAATIGDCVSAVENW